MAEATLNTTSKLIESTIERLQSMRIQVSDMEAVLHSRLDRIMGPESGTRPGEMITLSGGSGLSPITPPPRSPPSTLVDYIRELDEAIAGLSYQLNRLS